MAITDLLHKSHVCPLCKGSKRVRRGEWEAWDRWRDAVARGDKMAADNARGGFTLAGEQPNCPEFSTCPHCEAQGSVTSELTGRETRALLVHLLARVKALESKASAQPGVGQ